LNKKEHYVAITVVLIVLFILIMVTFSRANEGLDKFEKQELENGTEQYLSKGAS